MELKNGGKEAKTNYVFMPFMNNVQKLNKYFSLMFRGIRACQY